MAEYIVAQIKGTIALAGGRAFFCACLLTISKGKIMANKSVESFMAGLEDQFKNRRGFLTGATAAIVTGAAFQLEPDKSSSLTKMASDLHDAIGQFTDDNLPSHVQVCADGRSLNLEVEPLRDCSVDEIENRLQALFGNFQDGAS